MYTYTFERKEMFNENLANEVKQAIDRHLEENQEDGRRAHLGASIVGRQCLREIYHIWRWSHNKKHSGRMLRLFDRGHREEDRFIEWLSAVCTKVWPIDPRTGEQIRVKDFKGYFGGSLDAVIRNPVGYKGDYLGEFKTHNQKSYEKLIMKGVQEAKPEHYDQMQIYLYYKPRLLGALYFAINKNDDSLHIEFVQKDEKAALAALARTQTVLLSPSPPAPFEGASEYNFYCNKFCDFGHLCWKNGTPDMSCRTCRFVQPTDDGWKCNHHEKILNLDEQKQGCDNYERGY